uniref:Reverse transcriptase domain-containing protein n=2 Tax=Graphocephala atropunctata TaxID=36148 RepID=A0A1B6M8U9_9HEMI
MILCKDSVSHQFKKVDIHQIKELVTEKEFECCSVAGKIGKYSIIVVGLYRTPGATYDQVFLGKLDIALGILCKNYNNVILAGDINIDILKNSRACDMLKNILTQHSFQYLVDFPTRVTLESQSSIDNVFTNINRSQVTVSGVITELSDHDAQLVEVDFKTVKRKQCFTQLKRKFTKQNTILFQKKLEAESWLSLYLAPVDQKYDLFYNIFIYHFNLCFPLVRTRVYRNENDWINNELRKDKEELIHLSQNIRVTKDRATKEILNYKKKLYRTKAQNLKKDFINNKIKNSDNICKSTWKVINNETKPNQELLSKIRLITDGEVTSDPYKVSEIFNNYFIGMVDECVIPNLQKDANPNNLPFVIQNLSDKRFHITPVDEIELDKIISSFKNKYSAGYDEVPMPIIKNIKHLLVKPLAHVINSSFVSGIFPNRLKISKIKTIFKKGNTTDPSNYRPLSILPTFSKIYERVMYIRLVEFLENNNKFDEEQHGFRSGRSVITAGIEFVESTLDAIDRGDHAVGIFMDLSKAFDSVCHSSLIGVLNSLGISGVVLDWFISYLKDRNQYVELSYIDKDNQISFVKSQIKTIKYGVPQGSILGPILFLCYINGLPKSVSNINSRMFLYADDSNLLVSHKSLNEIQNVSNLNLISILNYFSSKNLLLNPDKTNFISFRTRQNRNDVIPSIEVLDTQIKQVDQTKFLGLIVDKNLTWDNHIQHIEKKISSGLFVLYTLSKYCELDTLKMVYYSHIQSHISFGVVLYGATSDKNLQKILILQKKAIRIMLKLHHQESVRHLFSNLGILTIYGLYILETVLVVKKVNDTLPKLGASHNYLTRNRNQLAAPHINLKITSKKPEVAGIKFYNSLPEHILKIDSFLLFKKTVKQYLISKTLYSFDEFFIN